MAHDEAEKVVRLEPAEWGADAERLVPLALQHATVAEIRRQVETGAAALWHVLEGEAVRAVFVLRVDHDADGSEGVIVAAAGACRGVDLTAALLPHVERLFLGCRAVRIHTARPGMARKLARMGYVPREVVFGKVCNGE